MCEWLDKMQRGMGLEGVTRRAARYFGVLLCARCSEYLAPIDDGKILLVRDVMPMKGKQYCDWGDEGIDGFMIRFRGSKTDKYNEGCLRYVGITEPLRGGNKVPHVRTKFCRKLLEWSVWQSQGETFVYRSMEDGWEARWLDEVKSDFKYAFLGAGDGKVQLTMEFRHSRGKGGKLF